MRRRDRQVQERRRKDDDGRVEISCEARDWLELEDLAANRLDDAPAADGRAAGHRRRREDLDVRRDLEDIDVAAREQRQRDDTHRLLRIVRAV